MLSLPAFTRPFTKPDTLQSLPLLQAFTACFSKFSLSANLAAGKKASCILKFSPSVVVVDVPLLKREAHASSVTPL